MVERTTSTPKELVRLRFKKLADNSFSIYLDTYDNGIRHYEFLRLYLVPEVDRESQQANANTLRAANIIKARRIVELANGKAGIMPTTKMGQIRLVDYIERHIENSSRTHRGNSYANTCRNMSNYLFAYLGKKTMTIRMKHIDLNLCKGFAAYLRRAHAHSGKPLSKVTVHHYFGAFKSLLTEAVIDQVIPINPVTQMRRQEIPERPVVFKNFLEADDLVMLAHTPCGNENVRRAFMFSCFTGLRLSDVRALKWHNIKKVNGAWRCSIIMQKTLDPIDNKLNEEAVHWLPNTPGQPYDLVFPLPTISAIERHIATWTHNAGVYKHVTFHTARHSYATMALIAGADLYTVSKLLGHRNIRTTTIYAAVVDAARDKAVDGISDLYKQRLAALKNTQ
ncbi:MAG: site-specific integrase [Bacteroidaceae bacterium]|nr:site-specific integrase [Bacteroidaceae bacterium]